MGVGAGRIGECMSSDPLVVVSATGIHDHLVLTANGSYRASRLENPGIILEIHL
jgi:hypothetical protein